MPIARLWHFPEHRPISWTRQVKVPRQADAGVRGLEVPQRPLRRYSVCGIRVLWHTRVAVLWRHPTKLDKGFCLSAFPLAVLSRTGECHHLRHHYYSKGASFSKLPPPSSSANPFPLPRPHFPLTPRPYGFSRREFLFALSM